MTLKLACNQAPVDVNYLMANVKVVGDIIRTLRVFLTHFLSTICWPKNMHESLIFSKGMEYYDFMLNFQF